MFRLRLVDKILKLRVVPDPISGTFNLYAYGGIGDYSILVCCGDKRCLYRISNLIYERIPIQFGSGTYFIRSRISSDYPKDIEVEHIFNITLNNEFAPWVSSNFYAKFNRGDGMKEISDSINKSAKTEEDKVYTTFRYIKSNIKFDTGSYMREVKCHTTNPEEIIKRRRGDNLDFASLFATLTRLQRIPTKICAGTLKSVRHFWNEVYYNGEWTVVDLTKDQIGLSGRKDYKTELEF